MERKKLYAILAILLVAISATLLGLYLTNHLFKKKGVKVSGTLSTGCFTLYIPIAIIHDPPGDHSLQTLEIIIGENSEIKSVIEFQTNSSTKVSFVTSVLNGTYVTNWVKAVDGGYEVLFEKTPGDTKISLKTSSSNKTDDAKRIGPSRNINGTFFGGCIFLGQALKITYTLNFMGVKIGGKILVDEYILKLVAEEVATIVSYTTEIKDIFCTKQIVLGDTFEKLGNRKYLEEITVVGGERRVLTKETKFEKPISFKYYLGKIGDGENTIHLWSNQTTYPTGNIYYRTNATIFDDEENDKYKIKIYLDTLFNTYDFEVEEYTSTNPKEIYK